METWVQWAGGIAFTVLTAVLAFVLRRLDTMAEKHSEDVRDLHTKIESVKDSYVRRDDFQAFRNETAQNFGRVEDKLDRIIDNQQRAKAG